MDDRKASLEHRFHLGVSQQVVEGQSARFVDRVGTQNALDDELLDHAPMNDVERRAFAGQYRNAIALLYAQFLDQISQLKGSRIDFTHAFVEHLAERNHSLGNG